MSREKESADAALVVGAGISGMRAALDLAQQNISVYLVDSQPYIGGAMVKLDKTYPTQEDARCVMNPLLLSVARHPNITLMTFAEVTGVAGKAGNFTATVRKQPRYVDENACTGCGDCAAVCPVECTCDQSQNALLRKAIYRPHPYAHPNTFVIDKNERSPCVVACPAGVNAQGYLALISQGKFTEARDLIMDRLPLPGIIGRICPRPCEEACSRNAFDEPLAICALKRFVADNAGTYTAPAVEKKKEKVAIVGSGPAGLSAAYFIAREGYGVTVFEALPYVGGMLYTRIPDYRLPRHIIEKDLEPIRALGVDIRANAPIDESHTIDTLFSEGYQAVFLATGAHEGIPMNISGEDADGVISGERFLRKHNVGDDIVVGKNVVVVGGGNVAIDAARTAVRLGAKNITILYRRSRAEMPASQWEINEAEREGIFIEFQAAPTKIRTTDGKVSGVECVRMALGKPDASGRKSPAAIAGSEFTLSADTIITAIGQRAKVDYIGKQSGVELTTKGVIKVNPITFETSRQGVFSGGDAITGPRTAVEAIAAGRESAISIVRYLRGEDLEKGRAAPPTRNYVERDFRCGIHDPQPRVETTVLTAKQRVHDFEEVESAMTAEQAVAEAKRCLQCGHCAECMECVRVCKPHAINHAQREEVVQLRVGAIIVSPGFEEFNTARFTRYRGE